MRPSQANTVRVMIVVGEASGDLHGANFYLELKKILPAIECCGLGGKYMQQAGVDILFDAAELSVVGLVEVLKHYPRLHGILNKMRDELRHNPPDLLVLIDSPDFNLPLAKTAKQNGIKVMYYISPQIWAWRSSRIKIIKRCVDMMAVVFPFEVKFYQDAGVAVEYVGHPLIEDAIITIQRDNFFAAENLDTNKKLVGLFPGSRVSEIEKNFPALITAAAKLSRDRNDIQFIAPVASTIPTDFIRKFVKDSTIDITTTYADIYNVINACDAIAATSGTVTLQITLLQTPMLVIYKVSPVTYKILRRIVTFTYACIANVIAGKEICREFIQENATTDNIAVELDKLLSDHHYQEEMKKNMREIREALGKKDGSVSAARLAAQLISAS